MIPSHPKSKLDRSITVSGQTAKAGLQNCRRRRANCATMQGSCEGSLLTMHLSLNNLRLQQLTYCYDIWDVCMSCRLTELPRKLRCQMMYHMSLISIPWINQRSHDSNARRLDCPFQQEQRCLDTAIQRSLPILVLRSKGQDNCADDLVEFCVPAGC